MLISIIFLKYIINPIQKTKEIAETNINFCPVIPILRNITKKIKIDTNKSNSLIVKMALIPLINGILYLFFNNMGNVSSPNRKGNILLSML